MSQMNVEIVQRAVAAIKARDLEGYVACCTEDIELHTPLAPVGGVYVGANGPRQFMVDIEDAARTSASTSSTLRRSERIA